MKLNGKKISLMNFILTIKYDVLKDDGDTCSAFEFAFTQFTDILTLSEINELICDQIFPHLKGKYDEVNTTTVICSNI